MSYENDILYAFSTAKVFWQDTLIECGGYACVGAYASNTLSLKWHHSNLLSNSALFHELHHLMDDVVFGNELTHENEAWWGTAFTLMSEYRKIEKE
jgi:hypothetical protein